MTKIIPTGEWLFVVTTENNCNVIMISQNDINKLLLTHLLLVWLVFITQA